MTYNKVSVNILETVGSHQIVGLYNFSNLFLSDYQDYLCRRFAVILSYNIVISTEKLLPQKSHKWLHTSYIRILGLFFQRKN